MVQGECLVDVLHSSERYLLRQPATKDLSVAFSLDYPPFVSNDGVLASYVRSDRAVVAGQFRQRGNVELSSNTLGRYGVLDVWMSRMICRHPGSIWQDIEAVVSKLI